MKSTVFLAVILLFAVPSMAQNSKGDKPATNPSGPFLRIPKKLFRTKGADRPNTRDITGRKRIRTKNKSSANKVIYEAPRPYKDRKLSKLGDRPTQAKARTFSRPPSNRQHAWKGTLQGGQLRVRSVSAQRARHNVYPANGPYVNNSSRRPSLHTRPITRTASGKRVKKRSASQSYVVSGKKNVYWGKFSKGERAFTKDLTGRALRTKNFQSPAIGVGTTDSLKISRRKPARMRANSGKVAGGYVSASHGQQPWTGDVSGQKLRLRPSRQSDGGGVYTINARFGSPKKSKKANRPLPVRIPGVGAGGIAKSLRNATGTRGPKGGGSISGKRGNRGRPIDVRAPGVGAAGMGNFRGNIKGGASTGFNRGGAGFSGRFKTRRPLKGGGSVSGKVWNNNRSPIDVRTGAAGSGNVASFQGNFQQGELSPEFNRAGAGFKGKIKGRRPLKGGGSVSGKVWNNNRSPIEVRTGAAGSGNVASFQGNFHRGELQPGFGNQGYGFSGKIRSPRPLHGGGSVSGKFLRMNRQPIQPRLGAAGFDRPAHFQGNFHRGDLQPGFGNQGYGFAGKIRAREPQHGGGSVSGKFLRNNRQHIDPRLGAPGFDLPAHFQGNFHREELQPGFGRQGYGFSGNIKAKRPQHGGGSISGKLFKNNGKPIDVHPPGKDAARAGLFSGNLKASKPKKGGGSISGRLFNNNGKPIEVRLPGSSEAKAAGYSGKMQIPWYKRIYIQNPKAADASLKKKKPHANTYLASGLQVKDKQEQYRKKPHASGNALPGIGPKQGTVKASEYAHAMKMYWSYKHNPHSHNDAMMGIKPPANLKRLVEFQGNARLSKNRRHNPSSHDDAMKVLAPGKAYARINDFAGNLKMKKYNDRQLHPDAQFAHGFRNNVKDERTLMINLKLFWARMFKKNDNQPGIVKEKEHRPRYDKKERDLWKALYD